MEIIKTILEEITELPSEMCWLVGTYAPISNTNKIEWMLATQETPVVRAYDAATVNDSDEILSISYRSEIEKEIDRGKWFSSSLCDRLESLPFRLYWIYFDGGWLVRRDPSREFSLGFESLVYFMLNSEKKKRSKRSILWSMKCTDMDIFRSDHEFCRRSRVGKNLRDMWDHE